ncbi:MAG: Omp28-related outer membrane protein [Taibaiella sp.]|nr:Omp28-related outer membrane protein [Taibaiella sp.]
MKRLFPLAVAMVIFCLTACKEKAPLIDFGTLPVVDTTYTASPEAVQNRNVLIEEFTGVSCANCPAGHKVVASIEASYPNRIVAIGLYEFGVNLTEPIIGLSHQDLRNDSATIIATNVYLSVSSLPTAGIDRVLEAGKLQIDRSLWPTKVAARISTPPAVNMYLTSKYNSASNVLTVTVKTTFPQSTSTDISLTTGITEDSIVEAQEDGIVVDTIYVQNHVLRDYISAPTGSNVLHSVTTKAAGTVFQRTYTYTLPAKAVNWNLSHCKVFAFMSVNADATTKEVLQAVETPLKGL